MQNEENPSVSLELIGSDALGQLTRAEIDTQISTAKKYPRDFSKVKKQMLSLATLDEETAAGCFYKLNRQGKSIEGPSVRMAEIAVSCFGNIRAGARIIANDGKTITAQGICTDLENNVSVSVEIKRRITNKEGVTYNEDMQVVTGNAACAIAFRNAAFKVVPMALVKPVYESAKLTAIGDIKTLADRRTSALKYFAAIGVTEKQVLSYLGKTGVDGIDLVDMENLIGLTTAIKDGTTTVDEAFSGHKVERVKPTTPFVASAESTTTVTPAANAPAGTTVTVAGEQTPAATTEKPAKPKKEKPAKPAEPATVEKPKSVYDQLRDMAGKANIQEHEILRVAVTMKWAGDVDPDNSNFEHALTEHVAKSFLVNFPMITEEVEALREKLKA